MASVQYLYPVAGTTPPTLALMANLKMLNAAVNFADADTTFTITHNLGLSTAYIALGFPVINLNQLTGGASTTTGPAVYTVTSSANTTTINKSTAATLSGGTVLAAIARPYSVVQ
jgi:hypothetical protein